jgi:hypothetical protein
MSSLTRAPRWRRTQASTWHSMCRCAEEQSAVSAASCCLYIVCCLVSPFLSKGRRHQRCTVCAGELFACYLLLFALFLVFCMPAIADSQPSVHKDAGINVAQYVQVRCLPAVCTCVCCTVGRVQLQLKAGVRDVVCCSSLRFKSN